MKKKNVIWIVDDQHRGQALGANGDVRKYVAAENAPWLLFNLNEDPYKQANLLYTVQYMPKMKELNACLKKWIQDTDDIFELPNI